MAADQVKENPEAKAADSSASDAQPDAPATAEKEAADAGEKMSQEVNNSVASTTDDQTDSTQNKTNDAGDTTASSQDAGDQVDVADDGVELSPWQKELAEEREDLRRKFENGELDANGLERRNQLEAGFKSIAEARAKGASEAQIRAQFGNLILQDGVKSIELDGNNSGRDISKVGNFSLTMDGRELVNFNDANWGFGKDNSANAVIDVNLPDDARTVENPHGKMSVVEGADGTNARIIEKDGMVLVNRGDEYVAMQTGNLGFGQQVLEGEEAKKLFEAEEKNFEGVETASSNGHILINNNGVNLVDITMGNVAVNTPEDAQVTAQNSNGNYMQFANGTQMIKGADNTAMIRKANGDVIQVAANGQITEMDGSEASTAEAWNNQFEKFETDVKVAGADGPAESIMAPDSWRAESSILGNLPDYSFPYDLSIDEANYLASAGDNPLGDANADLAAASDPGMWGKFTNVLYDGVSAIGSGIDYALTDTFMANTSFGAMYRGGKYAWGAAEQGFSFLMDADSGSEAFSSLDGAVGADLLENYGGSAIEGLDNVQEKDLICRSSDRGSLKIGDNGVFSAEKGDLKFDRFEDGTEKITLEDGHVFRQTDGTITRVLGDGSTVSIKEGTREYAMATGQFDRLGHAVELKSRSHEGAFDASRIKAGEFTQFRGAEGESHAFFTRNENGEIVKLSAREGEVFATLKREDGTEWRGPAEALRSGDYSSLRVRDKDSREWRAPTKAELGSIEYQGPPTADGTVPNAFGLTLDAHNRPMLPDGTSLEVVDGRRLRLTKGEATVETTDGGGLEVANRKYRINQSPAGEVVAHNQGDPPDAKPLFTVTNNEQGEPVYEDAAAKIDPNFTFFKPMGFTADREGNLFNGEGLSGEQFFNSSTGEFNGDAYDSYDGWASSGYDSYGYNSPEQMALEAKAEAEAQTASGLAQSVAAKVAAAVASGNVSAVLSSMSEVMGAYGTIAAAQGMAIEAGDTGLAGMLALQTSQVNAAASQIVATTINVQENNRVGGPLEGDSSLAKGLTTMTYSIANPLIKRAEILRNMGRTDDPLVKQYTGNA